MVARRSRGPDGCVELMSEPMTGGQGGLPSGRGLRTVRRMSGRRDGRAFRGHRDNDAPSSPRQSRHSDHVETRSDAVSRAEVKAMLVNSETGCLLSCIDHIMHEK
jgi:hypothetical protein